VDFVKEKVLALLGMRPQVFAVSARQARRAKAEANEALLRGSGFGALEGFVTRTLNEGLRVRLKLMNPLGVGLRVLADARQALGARLDRLQEDVVTLEEIESQLALHRDELGRGVRHRMAGVESAVSDFERRGREFLERSLRLAGLPRLLSRGSLAPAFEEEVVNDLAGVVEKRVDEIAEWMVAREVWQWQRISDRLQRRQAAHADHASGPLAGPLEFDLSRLLKEVRREAERAIDGYDHAAESRRVAIAARLAAAGTAVLQLAALAAAAAALWLSPPLTGRAEGILAAGALSVAGLLLPGFVRRHASDRFGQRVAALRGLLASHLKLSFDRELEHGRQRARDAVAPYRRFVRAETDRLRGQREELATLQRGFDSLKSRIESR
jgi:hypothetical protein